MLIFIIVILIIGIAIPLWIRYSDRKWHNERINRMQSEIESKYGKRIINKNLSLLKRNEDIIQDHLQKIFISILQPSYSYLESCVISCIDDIACAEGDYSIAFAPKSEDMMKWAKHLNDEYSKLASDLYLRFYNGYQSLENSRLADIQQTYSELIQKFYEIAERKISIIDDYGEEHWDEMPKQIDILISKISKQDIQNKLHKYDIDLLRNRLEKDFKEYHKKQKRKNITYKDESINKVSGIDFETFLSRKLIELGYEVAGTPTVGDQGADIIAKKKNKVLIIQAKRYSGSVGNKAVQEVAGALKYYKGDQACVITNSVFTPSAKALAQKNDVILIDGHALKSIEKIL